MRNIKLNPNKRSYGLPTGCKDLIDVLHGPKPAPSLSPSVPAGVNGRIRAPKVRVVGEIGQQLGVMSIADAIALAQSRDRDLVEIAPHAIPPVCRIVDYGKFRAQLSLRKK
jgi:hypothetical protein